jgi:ATP-binding cassette, subfamily A (ABC1), member 3
LFNFTVNPLPNPTYLLPNLWIQANSNLQQAFIGPIIILALDLVRERKSRLREYLRIHGLKESMYWLSWLITVFISMMILVGFVWSIPAAIGMFKQDAWWPFIILLMYGFSCISFGVWASTMSATPQMAGVLVILFTWIIGGFSLYFVNAGYGVQTAISLLSPIAFQFAMTEHTRQEMLAIGVAPQEVDGFGQFSRPTAVIMMAVDTVLYLLLAWWVSNVFPGEAGVPKPWYFMFTRSYWCPQRHSSDEVVDDDVEIDPKLAKNFEPLDSNKDLAVKIRKLRKEFAGPSPTDPNFVAVDSLDLDIEKNTVFALLGQNGAGKSTTISMLTGLLGATSGDAFINGSSVRSEMDKVRDSLGICPQHDILIEDLTVEQHLEIFARLKGVPEGAATRRAVSQALEDVELTEKRDNKANELSGGMKRRLSLALALIGDSSVIFLDEPTSCVSFAFSPVKSFFPNLNVSCSGLDPVNRRGVWDLVKKNRQGRTFILTTHFMQEADILGDRICIMAHGKMRCCGTSEFLKRQLGRGYYLSVVTRKEGMDKKALKFIQENVSDAENIQNHGSDITFLLPFDAVSEFPTLFSRVEQDTQRDDKRQIFVNYGVSMTTLEDVFLEIIKVADDEKASEDSDDKKKSKSKSKSKSDDKVEMEQFGNDERDKMINPNSHKPAGGMQQFKALLKAKTIASLRSWPSLVSFLLIPAVFAALMLAATLVTVGRVNPDPVLLGGGNQTADLSRVVFNRTLLGSSVISYACLTNNSDCQLTGQDDFPLPSTDGANNVSFAFSPTEGDYNRSLILGRRGKEYFTGGSIVFTKLDFQSRAAVFRIQTRKEASESVPFLTNLASNTLIRNMTAKFVFHSLLQSPQS